MKTMPLIVAIATFASIAHAQSYRLRFSGPVEEFTSDDLPFEEYIYQYGAQAGTLIRASLGNPRESIVGQFDTEGGVLTLSRHDMPGGFFLFSSVEVFQLGFGATNILFEGYRHNQLLGSDEYLTSSRDSEFTLEYSSGLHGVWIDELRVYLDAGSDRGEGIDNLTLTVPTAPTLAVFAPLVLAAARRRRRRCGVSEN